MGLFINKAAVKFTLTGAVIVGSFEAFYFYGRGYDIATSVLMGLFLSAGNFLILQGIADFIIKRKNKKQN